MGSQFDGLVDRTRMFAADPTRQQLGQIEVDSIKLGGVLITASQGNRYKNGRLRVAGIDDNSGEVDVAPGPNCNGKGVIAQFQLITRNVFNTFARKSWSWRNDGSPDERVMVNGVERITSGDVFSNDVSTSWPRLSPKIEIRTAGSTFQDPDGGTSDLTGKHYAQGEDDGGRGVFDIFHNGSDEYYLPDGRRVALRSLIPAFVTFCEQNGIPLEIR